MPDNEPAAPDNGPAEIHADARKEAALRPLIIAAMLIGFGLYCFVNWGDPKFAAPVAWTMEHINQAARYLLTYWGPVVFLPGGVIAGYFALRVMRRSLHADRTGLSYAGQSVTDRKSTRLNSSHYS